MEVYAAQVSRMDAGVGRILATLEESDQLANTLVIFLSDNGASAEPLPPWGDVETFKKQRPNFTRLTTRDGREVRLGNDPLVMPGGEDSFASYGPGWANLSNTPFRYFKRWAHEGGIATPLIVRWPEGQLKNGSIVRTPFQLTDVMPTILQAARAPYPARCGERQILPCEGRSFLDALRGHALPTRALYWEHVGNAAIRSDRWKLVREWSRPWELYDTSVDRSELINVADHHPEIVNELAADWQSWADRVGVIPFETTIDIYAKAGRTSLEAAG
jgi:arylsulfatase